jgi:hypothetical protein
MDNQRHGIRASGDYAMYNGCEYFAYDIGDRVRLHSDHDPLPPGFAVSSKDWIRGEKVVPLSDVQQLTRVQTTCAWRGHHFAIGIIVGDSANVTYLGKDFDEVSSIPGIRRPDKFEVRGRAPVSELAEVEEHVAEVQLRGQSNNDAQRRDRE